MTLHEEINEGKVNQLSPDTFCYCNGPDEGGMTACDNNECLIEWFHMDCLQIDKAHKGKWYCPDCRKLDKFRRKKKK